MTQRTFVSSMSTRVRSLIPLAPVLLASAAPLLISAQVPDWANSELAQLTIHERLIIRIPHVAPPRGPAALRATPLPPTWHEKKGPHCVEMKTLTGAAIGGEGEVDLIVQGTRRLRAKLDDECPAMNFYSGFYLKPTKDGKICAGRDMLRSRSGARCGIDRFRKLVPAR